MKINDTLYGFRVTDSEEIPEAGGVLYLLTHEKSGATLAFLDREDDNKTFAISFNTPPEDDTGVFHIIEHSTLCGSAKFPVKEPFVELLKGSLNTFLNAMTYEDRTVYPVSSRCDKDFYNLTEVYLDAVFYPMMKQNPFIFMQEGWHYEYLPERDTLTYNGVVYNEMKGAYSSADEIGMAEITRMLYGGTSYGRDSGGDPLHIPELTYEKLCSQHDRYYHPSMARIYLDGSVDLDSILPLIDSYLSASSGKREAVSLRADCLPVESRRTVEFEISEDEDETGRARLMLGYAFSDYSNQVDRTLASVIISHLAASNESPLPKALLESGLCEDVILDVNHSARYTLTVEIKGIDPKNEERILEIYNSVIEKECRGMDRESLISTLNQIEFKTRERELGGFPVGVANALSVFTVWSYGGAPREGLVYEDTLREARAAIENGGAEKLLRRMITDNECRATLLMLPSKSLAAEREARIALTLKEKRESLSDKELSELMETEAAFHAWQESEDLPEAVATLPRLELSDVKLSEYKIATEEREYHGARLITHGAETRGIVYLSAFFDGGDLAEEELPLLSVLASLMTNLPTETHSILEIKREIKKSLGGLSFSAVSFSNSRKGLASPLLLLKASALSSNAEQLKSLVREITSHTVFENHSAVKKILVQTKLYMEELFTSNGEAAAMGRLESMGSSHGKISELLHGYESYVAVKKYITEIDSCPEAFMAKLSSLLSRLAVRERLTLSLTSDRDTSLAEELCDCFAQGAPVTDRTVYEKNPTAREAISIPSQVGYATLGTRLTEAKEMLGTLRVVRSVLSYEFLWNTVRVKGGAYGAGFSTRKDGGIYFYSYRDPSPEASLSAFRASADYLRALADSDADLTKFIIGALGEYDTLKTPRTAAAQATADLLTGWTKADEDKLRADLLATDRNSLLRAADLLDCLASRCGVAVAASSETLASFTHGFDRMLKL